MRASLHRSVFVALALVAGAALAQQPATPAAEAAPPPAGYRAGPGMMGGYGSGYGSGYGPGYGHGPGYGYRMGPGMMGGYAHGYGVGPGMMGGCGSGRAMGFGMMGGGMMGAGVGRALWALDLDDAQRKQVLAIQDELRRKHWELAGKGQEEIAKLRDAWLAPTRDRAAILAGYKRLGELRQQALEQSLDAADRLDRILTEQQREQLRRWGPWWPDGDGQ